MLVVASLVLTPLYVPRYAIAATPLAALAVAAVVWASRWHTRLTAALVVLACAGLPLSWQAVAQRPEDLRAAASYLAAQDQPGDCIVFAEAYARTGLDYYLDADPAAPDDVAITAGGTSAQDAEDIYAHEADPGQVQGALRQCSRIWLAGYTTGRGWQPVPSNGIAALQGSGAPVDFTDQAATFGGFELELVTPSR